MKNLKLVLLSFFCLSSFLLAANPTAGAIGASVFVSPQITTIENLVGGSLFLYQNNGSSLIATYIEEFKPQVWVTSTGSSVTSYACSTPSLGSSLQGQTNLFGGSLTLPMSWRFHTPSYYPAYGAPAQSGASTFSVGGQLTLSNGQVIFPQSTTIVVNPLALPPSQISGPH